MNRKIKLTLILVATHAAVLAVGLVAGFYSSITKNVSEAMQWTSQGAMISHYSQMTEIARSKGDRDSYNKSLVAFLAVLDGVAKKPSVLFDAKTTSTDKAFTYERLSRLEKEAGNAKAAEDYLKLSVEACGRSMLKDCSVENITKISKKLEESSSMFSGEQKSNQH